MSLFKISVFYFIIFNTLVAIRSLVELPTAENNNIAATEAIIRTTVNDLFSSLRLKDVKRKPRLKQFLTIHNFFVSLTLRDHDNLNEIVRLTRERDIDNTSIVTKPLNELLNEDNNDDENEETVTLHVETFLNKLRHLKDKYNVNNLSGDTIVNKDILKILETNDFNFTKYNELPADNGDKVLDDIEFWRESGRRIYRGSNTKIKYFPFMASVQFFRKFQCAGSVIKSDLVITAASCLQLAYNNRFFRENPAFLSVNVGSTFYEGGGENIPVLEIYFHPTYNPKNLMNNLALMRTLRRLNLKKTKRVQKIDFDRHEYPLPVTTDGITIVGWGAKGSSNILDEPWSNRLSFSVIDFYPLRECREIYTKEYVTKTNFCAGFLSKGGGACNRDVGGPGIVDGLLTGVVSFGSPVCGAPDAPTVFTKLGYYTDWIEEIMEQEVPEAQRKTTLKSTPTLPTMPPSHATWLTTFKVDPLPPGKPRPIPAEPAALRIFEEPDFFTNFLATMFNSNEIKEYNDLIDSMRQKAEEVDEETTVASIEEVTEVTTTTKASTTPEQFVEPATKLDIYDVSQEKLTKKYKMSTAMDVGRVQNNMDANKHRIVSSETDEESAEEFESDGIDLVGERNVKKATKETKMKVPKVTKKLDTVENIDESVQEVVKPFDDTDMKEIIKQSKIKASKVNTILDTVKNIDDSEQDIVKPFDDTHVKKVTKKPKIKAPKLNQKLDTEENVDDSVQNILKLLDNTDMNKITKTPKIKSPKVNNNVDTVENLDDSVQDIVKLFDNNDLMKLLDKNNDQSLEINKTLDSVKNLDDSVLTLLYLTDNEKKTEDANDSGEGLSIPAESFKDMTFRQNITGDDYLDLMSKADLLNLLSQAIDLEIKKDDK